MFCSLLVLLLGDTVTYFLTGMSNLQCRQRVQLTVAVNGAHHKNVKLN